MSRQMVRPGGRSARVQASVHTAVRELEAEVGRDALTVPLVAQRAGVTPSTIYRRWGDLAELLSDVAVERLRPDTAPKDHGGLASDLAAWAEQFLDEMASPCGRAYIRDALLGDPDGTNMRPVLGLCRRPGRPHPGPRDRTRGRRPRGRDGHRPRRRPPDVPHSLPPRRTRRRLRPRTRGGAPRPGRRGRVTTRDTVVPVAARDAWCDRCDPGRPYSAVPSGGSCAG